MNETPPSTPGETLFLAALLLILIALTLTLKRRRRRRGRRSSLFGPTLLAFLAGWFWAGRQNPRDKYYDDDRDW